jgi:hypothetical protein
MRPGQPASLHAALNALMNDVICLGRSGPPRPSATILKNTRGSIFPALLQGLMLAVLCFQQASEPVRERERAALAVLRRAGFEPDLARFEVDLTPFERQDF